MLEEDSLVELEEDVPRRNRAPLEVQSWSPRALASSRRQLHRNPTSGTKRQASDHISFFERMGRIRGAYEGHCKTAGQEKSA